MSVRVFVVGDRVCRPQNVCVARSPLRYGRVLATRRGRTGSEYHVLWEDDVSSGWYYHHGIEAAPEVAHTKVKNR